MTIIADSAPSISNFLDDTVLHIKLKDLYRQQKQELAKKQLHENLGKIPQPSRDKMMKMVHDAHKSL